MAQVIKTYECPECGIIEREEAHTSCAKKCWICKSKVDRIISAPIVSKDGGPRTVGALMDRNNKKNPLAREKRFQSAPTKESPQAAKLRAISKMTDAQKAAYIETGKGV